ncbi:NAD(P)H-binding protein [Terrimonas sp. NA20]|uniref:NAD(P)H-binding protein n=1 Tax=Terrimonas ginsenosidimutans TaxID=2908004 RepID=A0ABS9KPN5_9BACT|nr:NAD(P)H-binding protein [Terrimonas ginsenosidimutans]MCG2614277.1 NAD(P)H-binding protein [Terrimonas ginsenosidimutans]
MKFTLTGSLGNTGKPLAEQLVKAGHAVTIITSDEAKTAAIGAIGATAAVGSVTDAIFLANAFTGADAVFAMTPPNLGGSNIISNTTEAGKSFAEAIKKSGVKKVVMLSSIGADLPSGTGPIAGLYNIEQLYNQLDGVAVTFLRAGYFYLNFYNDLPVIRALGIMGANYPAATNLPLVHPSDIAAAAAEELQQVSAGKKIRYVISDIKTAEQLAATLGKAVGKENLPWAEMTDEQFLGALTQAGLPAELAGLYTEMGKGFREGRIPAHFIKEGSPVEGKIKLADFAREFAAKY